MSAPLTPPDKRRPIRKSVRFEVFKRDGFTCQYCGRTPPDVVLELDHIQPVSQGGPDTEDNLVAACFDCNRGKAARDLSVAPMSLSERAERVAEAEAQLAAYREIMEAARDRKEDDAWEVIEILFGTAETTKARFGSVLKFLERLPAPDVIFAAEAASRSGIYSVERRFRYFCGICWNKVREGGE